MSHRKPDPLFLQIGEQIRRAHADRTVEVAESITDGIVRVLRVVGKGAAKAAEIWNGRTPVRIRTPEALPNR